MADFQLTGFDQAIKRLRDISPKLQKKALNQAMRKGMAIVRKSAVNTARGFDDPSTPNNISKEIVVRSNAKKARSMGPGTSLVQVGVKGGAKSYKNTRENRRSGRVGQSYEGPGSVWHWRLLEFGTVKMRAQPFMRPALSDNVDAVTNTVAAELNIALDKIAKGAL